MDKVIFKNFKFKTSNLRTMNWLDPHQRYIGNLNKLLSVVTNE